MHERAVVLAPRSPTQPPGRFPDEGDGGLAGRHGQVHHPGIKANVEIAGLHQSEKARDRLALGEDLETVIFDQRD